jgi:hypothetical protein
MAQRHLHSIRFFCSSSSAYWTSLCNAPRPHWRIPAPQPAIPRSSGATELQQSCTRAAGDCCGAGILRAARAATELQQSCNRAATELHRVLSAGCRKRLSRLLSRSRPRLVRPSATSV